MISIKEGVDLNGLQPPMQVALQIVASIYRHYGYPTTITSALDGKHSWGSKHYSGLALDFRTRHLTHADKVRLTRQVRDSLGPAFDVVLEKTHLHVEYHPKQ